MMDKLNLSRRDMLIQSGAALTGLALLPVSLKSQIFPTRSGEEVIPFLDQPPAPSRPGRSLLNWEKLDSWITPNENFFRVSHYDKPVLNARTWKLEITGLVKYPKSLTLGELKARQRKEVIYTLECSGNHGFPSFVGAIGNARWTGTPLASILKEVGVVNKGTEVVFFGTDEGEEEIRGHKVKQNFARSLSLDDAMNPTIILCYEMNGEPLLPLHGYPVRLIVPGWFGIANVKWLKRIEVIHTRYMGRFMGRDYVTLRGEQRKEETVWMETSVGRTLLKSVAAKVTRKDGRYRIIGAAWGAPIQRVEVRIDDGPWRHAKINEGQEAEFAWKIWHLDWNKPSSGEHTIVSRAVDTEGDIQPGADDPWITLKRTYWESNGQVPRRVRIS